MEITALCKIVDNFGDVGVVWRMCRNLKDKYPDVCINLVIDNLDSFNKICSEINQNVWYQNCNDINIYNWNENRNCYAEFKKNDGEKLAVILEYFQCGRPEWMEKILFEDKLLRNVQIIMIDYLTAEKYAEDFHCLDSLTRSKKVKKVNFMPGFTEKTGSLVIDKAWIDLKEWNREGEILVFTYEKNWRGLADALKSTGKKVLVAQGRGKQSFLDAFANGNKEELPYMNQQQWDEMMKNCFALVIRGEESMSRACLSGIPFIWHAYPQSDEYQMVKVQALLDRMERHFSQNDFNIVKNVWMDFNNPEEKVSEQQFKRHCLDFFNSVEMLVYGFKDFALDLRKNGDLCDNLMTFINKICIMNQVLLEN